MVVSVTPVDPREAPLASLSEVVPRLGADELRVLALIASRLDLGRRLYGRLDVATDPRDWAREAGEEAADLLVYRTIAAIARGAAG